MKPEMTQPTIDNVECKHSRYSIDTHEQTGKCYDCGSTGRMRFIADSALEKPVPVEPVASFTCGICGLGEIVTKQAYDALQSALKLAQEERDELQKRFDIEVEAFYAERERAEKAEERNRRMVELLKEPSANMKSAGYGKPDYLAIFKAMSAELLKEVEK